MFYMYFVFLLCCWKCWYVAYGAGRRAPFEYTTVHCRDNNDKPVDWWYIYKPPSTPYMKRGLNYSYISADSVGRWQTSDRVLTGTGKSMLDFTLTPLYTTAATPVHSPLAYAKFEAQTEFGSASTSNGILMADEVGGVYLAHDVPHFPDLSKKRPSFPISERHEGHLIVCLSVDLLVLNELAVSLKQSGANFTEVQRPGKILSLLTGWNDFNQPINRQDNAVPSILDFVSKYKTVHAQLLVRRPGERYCLYKFFAKQRGVILDVYGQSRGSFCQNNYGIRSINTISVKYDTDDIQYINSKNDNAKFAVSTAAHWQKKGSGPVQYWSCIGTLDSNDLTERGGTLLCLDSFEIWVSFDNLKGTEPECR